MLHDERLRSTPVTDHDHERALAGACLLDDAIARLVLAEVEVHEFTDLTARLVLWAIMHGFEASVGSSRRALVTTRRLGRKTVTEGENPMRPSPSTTPSHWYSVAVREPFRDLGLATIAYGAIWGAFGYGAVRVSPNVSYEFWFGVAALACATLLTTAGVAAWFFRPGRAGLIVGGPAVLSGAVYLVGTGLTNRKLLFTPFSILVASMVVLLVRLAIAAAKREQADTLGEPTPYQAPGTEGPPLPSWKAPLMGAFYGGVFGIFAGVKSNNTSLGIGIGTAMGLLAGVILGIRDRARGRNGE